VGVSLAGTARLLCVVVTAIVLILQFTPVTRWYATKLAGNWTDSDGEVLIVPAAEEESQNILGLTSYWRCVYAIRAWRGGHFRKLVLSGGPQAGGDEPRAEVMRRFLVANGIPQSAVVTETRSLTTRENAVFTAQLISAWPGRKVLLTSDYHMFRAVRAFRAAGLDVVGRPFPDVIKQFNSPWNREYCAFTLATETVKIAGYWWKGWLKPRSGNAASAVVSFSLLRLN
jgi:uncharacterized SAM-binding protein YcdF (DUF218 family)